MSLIDQATQFIALKHEGQLRRGLTMPYATYLFGVGRILKTWGYEEHIVIAGLLHDIFEDSDTTPQEIEQRFGQDVLQIVQAISIPDKSISWHERKQQLIDRVRDLNDEQLAVSIAEKIQRLISMDYVIHLHGEQSWFDEGTNKNDQIWFYERYLEEIKLYHPNNRLLEELQRHVGKLYSII